MSTTTSFANNTTFGFDQAFYAAFAPFESSVPPPSPYPLSIGGLDLDADLSFKPYRREAFRQRTIASQRSSLNFDNTASEAVINTDGLWRRSMEDWFLGAGQEYLDKKKAADNRFFSSKGVNPWHQWRAELHQDVQLVYTAQASDGWVRVLTVGKYQYFLEHTGLYFVDTTVGYGSVTKVSDLPSAGAVGQPTNYLSMTHNGQYVFVSCGTSGIYYVGVGQRTGSTRYVNTGTTTISSVSYTFAQYETVFWGGDNLWASSAQYLLNFGGTGAFAGGGLPTSSQLLATSVGNAHRWSAWCAGQSQIYVAGYNLQGGNYTEGAVYRIGQTTSGSGTATVVAYYAPLVALPLTAGEYPVSLYSYLNYVFVGTNIGLRMCRTLSQYDPTALSTGDLEAGAIIPNILQPVTVPVTGFCANRQFVWWAWNSYDGVSTGLGRCDLDTFIDNLAPSYASDLMVTAQGGLVTLDWDLVTQGPLICVSNDPNYPLSSGTAGVYVQDPNNKVLTGNIDSGWLTYDVPDDKTLVAFHPEASNNYGSIDTQIGVQRPTGTLVYTDTGTVQPSGYGLEYGIQELRAEKFRVKVTLNRDASAPSMGPQLTRWTLKAIPNVANETMISAVCRLFTTTSTEDQLHFVDPYAVYYQLDQWRRQQKIVEYVEGYQTANVVINEIDFLPEYYQDDERRGFNVVCVVYMTTIGGFTYSPPPLQ